MIKCFIYYTQPNVHIKSLKLQHNPVWRVQLLTYLHTQFSDRQLFLLYNLMTANVHTSSVTQNSKVNLSDQNCGSQWDIFDKLEGKVHSPYRNRLLDNNNCQLPNITFVSQQFLLFILCPHDHKILHIICILTSRLECDFAFELNSSAKVLSYHPFLYILFLSRQTFSQSHEVVFLTFWMSSVSVFFFSPTHFQSSN